MLSSHKDSDEPSFGSITVLSECDDISRKVAIMRYDMFSIYHKAFLRLSVKRGDNEK